MKKQYSLMKVRIYPSGDFTLGSSSPPKKDNTQCSTEITEDCYRHGIFDRKLFSISTNQRIDRQAILSKLTGNLGEEKAIALVNAYETAYLEAVERGDAEASKRAIDNLTRAMSAPSLLGLSVATISHKSERKQRGLGGITPYGKRLVRSALAVMERKFSRECMTLGTCTLPALTPDEFEVICGKWSELTRQFFQEISRELERKGMPTDYVQVTEIQEKRFFQSAEVGLHLHWVIPGRKSRYESWAFSPSEVRAIWQRLLTNMLGREPNCDAATRIEAPRSSLAQELGKYFSKGVTAIQAVIKAGKQALLPSAWWGAAKDLKTEVKSQIIEINGAVALWLDRRLKQMRADDKLWYVDIWVENDGREFRAGAVGWFNSRAEIDELLEFRDIVASSDDMSSIANVYGVASEIHEDIY